MSPVAGVDGNLAVGRVEDLMSEVALHVVGRLVEVVLAGDVVLAMLADDAAVGADHHRRVPQDVAVAIALENRRDNDHVVLAGHCGHELGRWAGQRILGELAPGILFACAEGEWHCC